MPQDPPLPFRWAVVMWFIRVALWPFLSQQAPHGISWLVLLLVTALFWGFIIELLFMVKRRLWPNKPEPTAVGAVSSAVAVHVTSRRWLSFFR